MQGLVSLNARNQCELFGFEIKSKIIEHMSTQAFLLHVCGTTGDEGCDYTFIFNLSKICWFRFQLGAALLTNDRLVFQA